MQLSQSLTSIPQYSKIKSQNIESLEHFESQIDLIDTQNTFREDNSSDSQNLKNEQTNFNEQNLFSSNKRNSLDSIDSSTSIPQNQCFNEQEQSKNQQKYLNKSAPNIQPLQLDDSLFFTKQTLSLQDFPQQQIYENSDSDISVRIDKSSPILHKRNQATHDVQQVIKTKTFKKKAKKIEEEYFCSPNPQNLWQFGLWGTTLFLLTVLFLFERDTALLIIKIKIAIWILLIITLYCWDIYFLRWATEEPDAVGDLQFEINSNFYYKLKNSLTRNFCRSQIHKISDCLWFTSNVSINLLICNYCRAIWHAQHFIQSWIGIINHRYVHYKSTYFFILNGSIYQYIRPDGNVVFYDICLPINNYDVYGTNKNFETQMFDEIFIEMDHENETITQIKAKKAGEEEYDIITNRYEMHTLVLIINVVGVHLHSHLMANLVSELDESDFPQVQRAKVAVNGLNSAGLWISSLFVHGPQVGGLLLNNANIGIPHYPVDESAPWVQKSQMYRLFKAILEDKQICEIAKKYANKKEDPQERFTTEKLIKVGIACNFAVHGIDHWVHDRFCMVYCYNDYLRFNNTKQGFFGGRWNCDITSNFNKPCGRITEIVYEIIRKNTPQLLDGFQWTLEQ